MTTPDNAAYENRPSHWNEAHSVSLSGSEVIGAFSNAGNVSFAVETNGRITASANVTAAASPVNVTAGTTSGNLQTIAFSNSNGVSFGLNGSTITASHNGITTAAQSNQVVNSLNGSTGQISLNVGSSLSASTNGSSITFGLASNITTALQPAGAYLTTARASNDAIGLNTAQSNVTWTANSSGLSIDARGYAGTATAVSGNASLTVNSGGVSFNGSNLAGTTSGFTGANISATITHNTAGLAMSMSVAAPGGGGGGFTGGVSTGGNTLGDTGTQTGQVVFVGGNNVTLSVATAAGGAQTITISGANAGGAQTGISGIIVSNATYTSGTVSFSNANGISFGSSAGQAITASYTVPSTAGLISAIGVTGSNGNYTTTGISFSNGNGISFGTSAGSAITASHNGLTSQSNQALSAANGSFAFQTALFSNANGVSFITSAGSAIAASVETSYAASNHSHGNPTLALTNLSGTTASNSAGLTLSLSAAAPGGAASQTLYATGNTTVNSSGTMALSSLLFRGYGIVSLGTSNGSILVSSPDPTTLAPNWYAVGNTTGASSSTTLAADTISIQGAGGVSVGYSNGSIVISGGAGGGVTPVVSANNGSYSFTTLSFSNVNGISFGTSAGSAVTASYTVPSVTQYFSATNTTFNGANISGSMTLNTNGLQLSMSVAAPGAAAEANAIALLGANTAGNTTATGSTIGWSGVNLTLSGTNASQVVISAPATSSLVGFRGHTISTNGSTISIGEVYGSYFDNMNGEWPNSTTMQMLQSTSHIQQFILDAPLSFGVIRIPMSASMAPSSTAATTGATQFSYGQTRTHNFVLYSRGTGGSSQSLISVASTQFTDAQSHNISCAANSTQFSYSNRFSYYNSTGQGGFTYDYSSSAASLNYHTSGMTGVTGLKIMEFPWATAIDPGQYWLMYGVSTTTASQFTNVGTKWFNVFSNYGMSQPNLAFGTIGAASNSSVGLGLGNGSFTTAGGGTTSGFAISAVTTSSAHNKMYFGLYKIA